MNQEKIGKLIATLRKKQKLTQSELGTKVGVGDRAVSKWERGITCPDISIINDLSKVLGITSDELLAGELNDKKLMNEIETNNETKFNKKLLFIPIALILILVGIIIIIYNNRSDVYTLQSKSDEYNVVGKIIFKNNKMSFIVNQVIYYDDKFGQIEIINYEYDIKCGNAFLYHIGRIDEHYLLLDKISIGKFGEDININNDISIKINKKVIIKDGITLAITYLDEDDHVITSNINMSLHK